MQKMFLPSFYITNVTQPNCAMNRRQFGVARSLGFRKFKKFHHYQKKHKNKKKIKKGGIHLEVTKYTVKPFDEGMIFMLLPLKT